MTYQQHLYIRQTIVLLFFPFDRPILNWLAARTHARTEILYRKVFELDKLDVEIEAATKRKRLKKMAAEKAEREQAKQRNLSRVWPGATQPPKQKSITLKSNSTTVSSLLTTPDANIVCPTCKKGVLKVERLPRSYDTTNGRDFHEVEFFCPECRQRSLLRLYRDTLERHPGILHEKIRYHLAEWPSEPPPKLTQREQFDEYSQQLVDAWRKGLISERQLKQSKQLNQYTPAMTTDPGEKFLP